MTEEIKAKSYEEDEYNRFVEYALLGVVDIKDLDNKNHKVKADKNFLKNLRSYLEANSTKAE